MMESIAKGPNLSPSHSRFKVAPNEIKAVEVEKAAEMLLDVLLDCSIAKAPKVDRLVHLDLATFADVLDVLIPALESHRDCARQGL